MESELVARPDPKPERRSVGVISFSAAKPDPGASNLDPRTKLKPPRLVEWRQMASGSHALSYLDDA